MDLVIFLILLVVVIAVFRDFKFVVYFLGILEVFFNLAHYLGDNLPFVNINPFINTYIPTSVFSIASQYTIGIVEDILCWVLFACFVMFLVYLIKYFFKMK